jgi:hypothetical protein
MEKTDAPHIATEAQMNANRLNAQKSTGPRTPEGKAAASRNSLTHGLTANQFLILDEDSDEFLVLLNDLRENFRPIGPAEERLVLRIAANQWRLDRIIRMEATNYRQCFQMVALQDASDQLDYERLLEAAANPEDLAKYPPILTQPDDLLCNAFNMDSRVDHFFANIARYGASIERSIDRCVFQLKAFQAARHASKPSTPPNYETNPISLAPAQAKTGFS